MMLYGETTYSPDDGGYYVTVFTAKGKDVFTTDVHPSRDGAESEALNTARERCVRLTFTGVSR